MNLTFILIAISYFAVISMVLITFRFVRDRNETGPEYQLSNPEPAEEVKDISMMSLT